MKNKNTILIILGIILIILIGFYWISQNRLNIKNSGQQNQNGVITEETGAGVNNQVNNKQSQNKIITDDFSVNLPDGWEQTSPGMGISAMAVKINEEIGDPAAQKINFQSYFAVVYDTLQGKSIKEYLQTVKNQLLQVVPDVVFNKEQDIMINGKPAHTIEAELVQQGINFKVLMVLIEGKEGDVWTISFNTTKSNWEENGEIFYSVANSFVLNK